MWPTKFYSVMHVPITTSFSTEEQMSHFIIPRLCTCAARINNHCLEALSIPAIELHSLFWFVTIIGKRSVVRHKLSTESLEETTYSNSKVHWVNMGPTWVLSVPGRPHLCPINLAIRVVFAECIYRNQAICGESITNVTRHANACLTATPEVG